MMTQRKNDFLTSKEIGDILGFSPDYVRKLLLAGKIKGEKLGRNWIVHKNSLKNIHRQRFRKNTGV